VGALLVDTVRTPVAVLGAGPYGLSVAAHLREAGIEPVVFGEPMEFWRRHMPGRMLLRSSLRASHIADPRRELTLDAFYAQRGVSPPKPVPIEDFLDYAEWYRRGREIEPDRRRVAAVARNGNGFELTLEDGSQLGAERVVVATGLEPFPRVPAVFDGLPAGLVSHTSEHADLTQFRGRRVLVVGGGQSALESAALLAEAGARVEVVARALTVHWLPWGAAHRQLRSLVYPPTDVGGRFSGWVAAAPDVFRRFSPSVQRHVHFRCVRPAGAGWLISRLEGVPLTTGLEVEAASPGGDQVHVELSDGSARAVDHVLLGTGFEVDVRRYPFLTPELVGDLATVEGHPRLGPGLESSVPGLHFVGAPATASFGPIMRFVVGTWYAAPTLTRRVLGRRQRPVTFSF
jgi:NADPH-dependent 2,4-dienoyl-CoA reductase/sulfur reductase-like enzyme